MVAVDITKPTITGYGGNGNKNAGRQSRNQAFNAGNRNDDSNQIIQHVPRTESTSGKANFRCYNCNEKGHCSLDCQKPRVRDAKYFREQMSLAMKDEAESNLNSEENDFILDTLYGEETMEELTAIAVSEVNASSKVHEQMRHEKRKTIIQTSDDDQIDSNIIFDDPYVENIGGTSDHDSNDHDEYHKIQELETCKDRVKLFELKTIQCSKYKETCEELKRKIRNDKNTIERILKEKDSIQSDFFKVENEKIIIQHETQLAKKDFKERENQYLEDICDLEEKLTGLGYKNPERLKKAITAQPKMYDREKLHSAKLIIDSPDSEETLEDVEESRLKMINKMNKDLLITIFELKNKLKAVDKGKHVNTKFAKSNTLGTLLCVTPLPKNIAIKAKKVSNSKVNADRSKPVTSHPTPTNDQDVFLLSHEKCVAPYDLSRNSSVTRALFTTPIAVKSKNLGATFVVAKSRLSVAKTPTTTNKVSSVLLSPDSSQSRTLSNYIKKLQQVESGKNGLNSSKALIGHPRVKLLNHFLVKQRVVIQLVLWIVDSGCSKHMVGNLQQLRNFVEKFIGTVRFRNDHFAAITGYGDYVQGNLTICYVYYVEGLRHNLFSVRQFCDGDLEVAFRSNMCYVRNLEGDDLLTGSRDSNLYTIFIFEMTASSPVCLMSRATLTKSWLWHRRLSHLNFGTINQLMSKDLVNGLPKFKYNKDRLCSACEQGTDNAKISRKRSKSDKHGHGNGRAHKEDNKVEEIKVIEKHVMMLESTTSILEHSTGDRAVFAKVKHLHSIPTLKKSYDSEGFLDVSMKYVVDLWVLIEERLVWLDIEGIPLMAWSNDYIKRVARVWGEVVYMDDEEDDNMCSARVCVESIKKEIVMAHLEVDVEGKWYNIRVKEIKKRGEINENSAKNSSPSRPLGFESHLRKPPSSPMADSTAAEGQQNAASAAVGVTKAAPTRSDQNSRMGSDKSEGRGEHIGFRMWEGKKWRKWGSSNCISPLLNIQCMRSGENKGKKGWLKKLRHEYSINFFGIQETKMVNIDLLSIRSIWGNSHFDYASSLTRGLSGDERFGSQFDSSMTNDFNDFIEENDLIDPPLGGYQYTWVNKMATKMSKINRFLLSERVTDSFPNIVATILDKGIPDHRPIMLHEVTNDYGPTPFRFFHSWLDCADFEELVTTSWTSDYSGDLNPMYLVKKKLQRLKNLIKSWSDDKRKKAKEDKHVLSQKIVEVEKKADLGMASKEELNARQGKEGFLLYGESRWMASGKRTRIGLKLSSSKEKFKPFAVWDCGSDKSPGPDGFMFDFCKRFWHVLEPNIVRVVTYFHRSNKFPKGCNSSFITLILKVAGPVFIKDYRLISFIRSMYKIIGKLLANRLAKVVGDLISSEQSAFVKGRQIMDGPMILNEILNWYKKEKRKTLVFKVDFEKAYDTVCWDFLQEVMAKMGFGVKWCAWIRGCLTSSRASVLVNGSPIDEFLIHKGLRQGDPLSPFLFILVMEALHMLIERAKTANLVHGIRLDMAGTMLDNKNANLDDFVSKKVGDGRQTKFWEELWIGDRPLKVEFSRIFKLDIEISGLPLVYVVQSLCSLASDHDRWGGLGDCGRGLLESIPSSVSNVVRLIEGLQACEQTSVTAEGRLEIAMSCACGGPNSGSSGIPPQFQDHLANRQVLVDFVHV
ncbi:RNA-directed DNA polymerase, eukaryota, reverse transcriptase zinc-binding domain protein [Tanacetum coccineum]